jgi:hypothetical protein
MQFRRRNDDLGGHVFLFGGGRAAADFIHRVAC